jgi:hypothetical protein
MLLHFMRPVLRGSANTAPALCESNKTFRILAGFTLSNVKRVGDDARDESNC